MWGMCDDVGISACRQRNVMPKPRTRLNVDWLSLFPYAVSDPVPRDTLEIWVLLTWSCRIDFSTHDLIGSLHAGDKLLFFCSSLHVQISVEDAGTMASSSTCRSSYKFMCGHK